MNAVSSVHLLRTTWCNNTHGKQRFQGVLTLWVDTLHPLKDIALEYRTICTLKHAGVVCTKQPKLPLVQLQHDTICVTENRCRYFN